MSREGDPRYHLLVTPTLCWLDYLTINELEAGELSGLEMRLADGTPDVHHIAQAANTT